MKVLLYVYSPVLGGMFRHVIALASLLQKNGHEVLLVGRLFPEASAIVSGSGQPPIPFQPLAVEGKCDFRGLRRYRALLKRERPDVVHFHLGNTFESLAPMLLAVFMGYPVIVTEHYLPFPLARTPWLPLLAKRLAAKKIGKVILLGEGFVLPFRELVKIDAAKIAVIPPFSEKMTGRDLDGNPRVIGFAGGFSKAKGVDDLVHVAPRLLDLDYKIIFCGRGELENEIDRLVERYPGKIEKRFQATGMEAFYNDVGILLLLSRSEGLPLVVLEAIFAGVPVISTRVGVLEEYFEEGDGILYLDSSDFSVILSAMQKLADKNFREKVIRRGKEVFCDRLDPAKITLQIEKLYQELAGR
jgi:glycosyltransferase involved in cell wall biosynthesis